ncbi:ligand-binding sensor domain-containing protein [Arcticibacterium luteifluviistationis]|uniref:Regulator n=1 Tax=Arcticibacterium luteifluviistationis TaxID=1784714 RepID=A0A2Z4G889_9BACT|nr:two-component regulator propeller domain-containing protein [Arcticibacterium luteifluviistationis]AWV97298.1 regulator [Arcticibacterium luteifluviistationis]
MKIAGYLLSLLLFSTSCNGQVNSNSPTDNVIENSKPIQVIGTPPSPFPQHNPYNDTGLVSQYIRSIFQDSKGNYWFGPAGQSVARFDGRTLNYFSKAAFFEGNETVESVNGNSVHAIAEDQNGNIWFGTYQGVVKYDARLPVGQGKTFKSYTQENGLSNTSVSRKGILVDKAGTVWVGTGEGVFKYNPLAESNGGQSFSAFEKIPSVNITDIMEDKDGNIWFTSKDLGVFLYDGKSIKSIAPKAGLGNNYAGGLAEDKVGNIWFNINGGICRYDGKTFTDFIIKDKIGTSEIWGLYIEQSGIIWITARGSTTRFDPSLSESDPKAFTVFTVEDGINCCVQSMYQDKAGRMWWGTGQGLYRFDGKRFYQVKQNGPW